MNPPTGQTPLDYLNQIAPEAPKKPAFEFNLRTVIFGGLILIALVIVIAIVSSILSSSSREPWTRLSLRLNATAEVVNDANSKIKSSQLKTINSNIKLAISNTQRDLQAPLEKLELNKNKPNPRLVEQESSAALLERLENARLNARYDAAYAREMSYQLATILALLSQLHSSSSPQTKEILATAYNNLEPIHKSLDTYNVNDN